MHLANFFLSSLQRKVEPASLEENLKVTLCFLIFADFSFVLGAAFSGSGGGPAGALTEITTLSVLHSDGSPLSQTFSSKVSDAGPPVP